MSGHFRVVCVDCNATISQCRCPSPDKGITYLVCSKCAEKAKE